MLMVVEDTGLFWSIFFVDFVGDVYGPDNRHVELCDAVDAALKCDKGCSRCQGQERDEITNINNLYKQAYNK